MVLRGVELAAVASRQPIDREQRTKRFVVPIFVYNMPHHDNLLYAPKHVENEKRIQQKPTVGVLGENRCTSQSSMIQLKFLPARVATARDREIHPRRGRGARASREY